MSAATVKFEIKLNLPMFLGMSLLAHALLFLLIQPQLTGSDIVQQTGKQPKPIIVTIGRPDSKSKNSIFLKPEKPSFPTPAKVAKPTPPHKLNLGDLSAAQMTNPKVVTRDVPNRPGQMPAAPSALSGLRYGKDDFKKMASDPNIQGGADLLTSQRVALNFEIPEGKDKSELNESQLKLYGFLRRGAMKYVNSLSAEITQFELQNPHLRFPLIDYKQTLTGRLVYDNQGNLKQIKMVRWSNNDKLQGFFENVLKRLENLQNPPKELWVENGEFTVFVTLQING